METVEQYEVLIEGKNGQTPRYVGQKWEKAISSLDSPNFWKFGVADLVFLDYVKEKKTIVDLGCGTGGAALVLASKSQAEWIIGVDLMKNMVEEAKKKAAEKKLNGKVSFIMCDGRKLPFKPSSFDGLVSRGDAFCFLVPLKATIQELNRIMKPGGVIVLEMDNRVDWKPGTTISTGFMKTNDGKVAYLITTFTKKRDYTSVSYILDPDGKMAKQVFNDPEFQQKGYKSSKCPLYKIRRETVETRRATPTHWLSSKALKALIKKGGFKEIQVLGDGMLLRLFLDRDPVIVRALKKEPELFFEIERKLVSYTNPDKAPTLILRAIA